jgi:sigma-B regulation protein RsbU (phosphoserine phosphatase)
MDKNRLKMLAQELKQKSDMEQSIRLARKRQLHMLPQVPIVSGFEFSSTYAPCANVSGDFYDFIAVSEHEIGIALGDVSGHGIEAGIIMGMAKKALQIYARGLSSPKEVLSKTNADLSQDLADSTFVSAAYGVLEVRHRILRFCRAGNNPPYLVNPRRDPPLYEVKPNGMVIGVDKTGKRFPMITQEAVLQLHGGDIFLQYTDGVIEAPNREKQEFGEERFKELLVNNSTAPLNDLLALIEQTVQAHIGNEQQEDDITMVAFKVL